ncbi:hypothetical protein W97_01791 [Coniosporium apollinis CBS 100218]|uniref:Integral membrane protein n=1 Tax=Coniosporium apollinis (strain CBS 100218) TaxID=1168221 RepID=R7YKY2_CONA1|nr:uncharacterized protein W97_01791 [Coniosporium apollinis CBS 100218]EON62567.1 hypothetical protein W97_01791 [Coniosporium apollinis CBS 100218]
MDYFSQSTSRAEGHINPATTPSNRPPRTPSAPQQPPAPCLRIHRLPSASGVPHIQARDFGDASNDGEYTGRRRSFSDPQRGQVQPVRQHELRRQRTAASHMTPLQEENAVGGLNVPEPIPQPPRSAGRLRGARSWNLGGPATPANRGRWANEYENEIVDLLDLVDPEVSTLTTLNNVQNSLFVPYLGRYLNRTSTYNLSRHPTTAPRAAPSDQGDSARDVLEARQQGDDEAASVALDDLAPLARSNTALSLNTIKSHLSGTSEGHNYAVLPHGVKLEGWTELDKAELNDYVRHLLHSRKAKFRRGLRGFGKYVKTPLGAFVTIYSVLITFWGTAWVLFIIGWIYVGGRQAYYIEICDQILVALFAIMGIGLAPFRAVDTYHMIFVAHYHRLTWRLRKKRGLPKLEDHNDLPVPPADADTDVEAAKPEPQNIADEEDIVLTPEQHAKFKHHQSKFAASHTFYKPHETPTHYAFPLKLLIAVVVVLDCHSLFQMALAGTTWGIYYKVRPKALTAVILSCSITCNIMGGVLISIGDRRTRKKEVREEMFRQAVTEEAMKKMTKTRGLAVKRQAGEEGEGEGRKSEGS